MTFAAPYLLYGLIAVPLAALGYYVLEARRARRSAAWSRKAMLPNIVRGPSRWLRQVPAALFLLGLTLLLVGFARPQRLLDTTAGGAPTVVVTFDVSGSMAATDVRPTRIRAARELAIRFLNELPARYRVAVVTFGNNPHLVVEPTLDRSRVLAGLPKTVTALAGTATGDAVSYSVAVVTGAAGQTEAGSLYRPGAVLLLSDGAQTAGGTTPKQAAIAALVDYVPVDTVAIGTPRGVVTQNAKVNDRQTSTQIAVPVQPTTLRTLSQQTHGRFFTAEDVAQSPGELAHVWDNLRSQDAPGRSTRELSAAAGGAALLLILAGIVLSGLWFGRPA